MLIIIKINRLQMIKIPLDYYLCLVKKDNTVLNDVYNHSMRNQNIYTCVMFSSYKLILN